MVLMINRGLLYTPVGQLECQTGISFCKAVVPQQIWVEFGILTPLLCVGVLFIMSTYFLWDLTLTNDTIQTDGRQLVYNGSI